MHLVIVESPAKAKTINKYLGPGFQVVASYGHVRDLEAKDGAVDPDQNFKMKWEMDPKGRKRLSEIADLAKKADQISLATDPDREGEAISWHVLEVLNQKKVIGKKPVKRVVFNEITKNAITAAMAAPRELDSDLVDAYLARRALDFLVGFNLSPVLWRKLPGAKSAGRVQSVALRLVCDRELEIERFKSEEYWSLSADFLSAANQPFEARLTVLDGTKLNKFSLRSEPAAMDAKSKIEAASFTVGSVEAKPAKRHPQPPFTTSTLQQEASRKLGFSASRTMQVAQRLYEGIELGGETVGLITYMRTDGVSIANEALTALRQTITKRFGPEYAPPQPRFYKAKARNAQEAHEAIRPTDPKREPGDVARYLDAEQLKLYDLIWKRTLACQMESADLERTTADLKSGDGKIEMRATGTVIKFDGFLKLYQEGLDEPSDDDEGGRLPKLAAGEKATRQNVKPEQHFTEPPPRFSEATLVKKLEELGIGRPSTYASILSVLRDREYVRMEKNRFVPEDKGRLVTAFLESFFKRYVEFDFTAGLEEKLDRVSDGKLSWTELLREFWQEFTAALADTKDLRVSEVLTTIDTLLEPHLFPQQGDGKDPRQCPSCGNGRLSIKTGKFGAFIGCSNYPDCSFTKPFGASSGEAAQPANDPVLGTDPASGLGVSLKSGRFGPYLELGTGKEAKRASLPKGLEPAAVTLELALKLLALPRDVGNHPETGKMIQAGIGRFGPYLLHDGKYTNIQSWEEALNIGQNLAVTRLAEAASQPRGQGRPVAQALKELGAHPADGAVVKVMNGRYGPYVTHGGINATLPRGVQPESLTMERAVELLAEKAAKGPSPKRGRTAPAKKAAAKATTKAPAKKPAAKKAAPKKATKG